MLNLGINDASISYEVALELLGQSRQPFMQAIHEERQKPAPEQVFIRYCEGRLRAIDELQDDLMPGDVGTILRIFERDLFALSAPPIAKSGTYLGLSLRPDLQAAYDELDASGRDYAFAVCPTWQGDAWEVWAKQGGNPRCLSGTFSSRAEATAAGELWLLGLP